MHRPKRPDQLAREAAGEPAEVLGTLASATGTVKYWRERQGVGAIASEATAPWDIWCHVSHIVDMPRPKNLVPGERVELAYIREDRESYRYQAIHVRRLDPLQATE